MGLLIDVLLIKLRYVILYLEKFCVSQPHVSVTHTISTDIAVRNHSRVLDFKHNLCKHMT